MATDKKISELPVISAVTATDISVLVHNGADYQFDFTTLLQFINSGINPGASISFGTALPQNTSGKNGDIFINTTAGSFAQKQSGAWSVKYTLPVNNGTDGTILYGSGIPGAGIGSNNDTYINTDTGIFYHKTAGTWAQVFSMQTGPQGPKGDKGDTGATGANGKTILSGTSNPSNSATGTNGDLYLNTNTYQLFGPKTNGVWGPGTSIIGLPGEQGETGAQGAPGLPGEPGVGVATGGTTGQVLSKVSNSDFDTEWVNQTGGGGGGDSDINANSLLVNSPEFMQPGGNIYILGNSICAGQGASITAKRFTSLIATIFGFTEYNFAISGSKASEVDLSHIPVKSGLDKYLMIEYGTNEYLYGPTTTTAYRVALDAIVSDALGKGWGAGDLIFISTFAMSFDGDGGAADTALRAFSAVTKSTAEDNGSIYIDCYDSLRFLTPLKSFITDDGLHPNDNGHYLISKLVTAGLPMLYEIAGQSAVINGSTDVKSLLLKQFNTLSGKVGHKYILAVDGNGNVGLANSLKDNLELNKTYLSGALIQTSAKLATGFDLIKDIALAVNSKIYTAFNSGIYSYIQADDNMNMLFSTNYSAGQLKFYVSGGVDGGQFLAFNIGGDGVVSVNKQLTMPADKFIQGIASAANNKILPINSGTGDMEFYVHYQTGAYIFYVSDGTTGGEAVALRINERGRAIFQKGGSFADIPSARVAVNSTTEGFLTPRMTTTQKDAIVSPAEGLEVYNLTLHKKQFYNGSAWETVSSA